MSRPNSVPKYRKHKPTGQAVVTLSDGFGRRRDIYLGTYGTAASRREYGRIVSEWEARGRRLPPTNEGSGDATMHELMAAYWRWAQARYVKNGKPTSEQHAIRMALRFVRKLYGDTMAKDFGPLAFKAVRDAMAKHKIIRMVKEADPATGEVREVEKVLRIGVARKTINKLMNRIKGMFKWGTAQEMLPPSVVQSLACVAGLRKGEEGTREKAPIRPVPQTDIDATLPLLPPMVADIARVQLLSGARPGEILSLRAVEIDRSGPTWEYRPGRHKTEHHDRERIIFFGPQAQAILTKYLTLDLSAPLFRPDLSEEQRNQGRRESRKTTLTPSAKERRARQNSRGRAGQEYDIAAYRRAITRACDKAGVTRWTPHQLRHNAGTLIRKRFGLEASAAVLGHAELGVTQIYAEADLEAARSVAAQIG